MSTARRVMSTVAASCLVIAGIVVSGEQCPAESCQGAVVVSAAGHADRDGAVGEDDDGRRSDRSGANPDIGGAPDPVAAGDQDRDGTASPLGWLAARALTAAGAVDAWVSRTIDRWASPPAAPTGPAGGPVSGREPSALQDQPLDRSAFLIPGDPDAFPGRWCPAGIPFAVDYSQARAAGLDPGVERVLWREAAGAWTAASGGAYRLVEGADQVITTSPDQDAVDLSPLPRFSIGITYGGEPGAVPDPYAHQGLAGHTAGYGGISVAAGGPRPMANRADAGYIIIDAPDVAGGLPDRQRRLALYIHELGHALGLAHTGGEGSIMVPQIAVEPQGIGDRDRTAVRQLAAMPCVR